MNNDNEEMELEGEAPKSPKQDQVPMQLSPAQRWNKAQLAFQHMVELEENAKERSALGRRDKELKALIKELSDQARTGVEMVDKDQVQTAMELGGEDGRKAAAALSAMADKAAEGLPKSDFNPAPAGGEGEPFEASEAELARQSGRRNPKVAAG